MRALFPVILLAVTSTLGFTVQKPTIDENGGISHTICDGQLAELSCPIGKVISIVIGNYGRFSNQVCIGDPDNFVPSNNNCQNHKTKSILEKKCNGKSTCDVQVSTKTFVEDPCPLTSKYLEVKYNCVFVETTTTSTTSTTTTEAPAPVSAIIGDAGIDLYEDDDVGRDIDSQRTTIRCKPMTIRGVVWPSTPALRVARNTCPEGSTGGQTWLCEETGLWSTKEPNTTMCESQWTSTRDSMLNEVIADEDTSGVVEVLRQLNSDTRRPLVGGDVPKVVTLLERVVNLVSEEPWTRPVLSMTNRGVVEIINYVVRSEQVWKGWPEWKRRQLAGRLLDLSEKMMVTSSMHLSAIEANTLVQPSVTCEMSHRIRVASQPSDYFVFPSSAVWNEQVVDNVNIPREALSRVSAEDTQVYFSSMERLGEQMQPLDLIVPSQDGATTRIRRRRVVSRVVGVAVVLNGIVKPVEKLSKPLVLTFYHQHAAVRHMDTPTCAWWNTQELDWSPTGCSMKSHNSTMTVCECNHMTYFAVLMDVRGQKLDDTNEQILTMLTYFGCSVSIVCLLATFFCFLIFSQNGGDRVFIHENLCLMLAAAEVVFLVGIGRTDDPTQCGFIALGLLYLFLSALTWMLLEGFCIYRMLVEVFPTGSKKGWFLVVGYGLPALITASAYFFDPSGFGTSTHCWLRTDDFFIMFFVGPAVVILVANTLMLFKAMCVVYKHVNGGYLPCRHESDSGRNVRTWAKGALGLVFLLGVTWTFGLLWIDDGRSIVMAYVFTIANSLQGLFIFLFHVVFSDKMRKDMKYRIARCTGCQSRNSPQKRSALPHDGMSPTNGSATGSEIMYPSGDKFPFGRVLDTTSQFGYNTSRLHHPIYEPQTTYDYATIAYGDMMPGNVQRAPPAYHRMPPTQFSQDGRYATNGWHHRPPPEFSPPPPPAQLQQQRTYASNTNSSARRPPSSKMSDDSAYSDGGSSLLTTEVTPQGQTVLRFDLRKSSSPQMYCHEL
ncbi:unnamed protein product [Caenorhabditis auriculariae]|uniref:Latrophilin Cirl n=1 Tax=Caenorhabditis auriculariae TaxID=2777116 RepID=A0A8S1HPN3_9PELO|nr:unnamed protein product [Caenorhabditis auriculariae]